MQQHNQTGKKNNKVVHFFFFENDKFSYQDPHSTGNPFTTIEGIIKWYATIGAASIVTHWLAYAFWVRE